MYARTDSPAVADPEPVATLDFHAPPDRFLDVGHSEIAYRRIGSGPDVLFVHGWPLSGATWRDVAAELSPRFCCHLVDLPGAGFTRCHDPEAIDLGAHARTLRAVVERLDLDRYALVAHDSGAVAARLLAADDPERTCGLVMGNTEIPGHLPWQLSLYLATAAVPGGGALFATLLRSRLFRRSGLAFGTCFEDLSKLDGTFHELFVRPILDGRSHREGTLDLARGFDTQLLKDLRRTHERIVAPVKLLWGANDPFFPLGKARHMVDQFGGGAELEVLDPGKLFVHEERPRDFARAAGDFLARCFAD